MARRVGLAFAPSGLTLLEAVVFPVALLVLVSIGFALPWSATVDVLRQTSVALGVVYLWGRFYFHSPHLCKLTTLGLAVACALLAVVPPWLMANRTKARQNQSEFNLMTIGQALYRQTEFAPSQHAWGDRKYNDEIERKQMLGDNEAD